MGQRHMDFASSMMVTRSDIGIATLPARRSARRVDGERCRNGREHYRCAVRGLLRIGAEAPATGWSFSRR